MKRKVNFPFARLFVTLATPKVLTFGKTQINLVFRSLNRTFALFGCLFVTLAELNLFVPLAFRSLNRTFGFAEVTFARKNKEKQAFLWFFPRLIVTLHP